MDKTIGFIGLGAMGYHMVDHLLDAGYRLRIYDIVPEKCGPLVKKGAIAATSPADAATAVDAVFFVVPSEEDVFSAALGEGGAAAAAKRGCVFVNCSTIYPSANVLLGKKLQECGFRFLDAPATGSGAQAREGTQLFIASGDRGAFDEMLPLFRVVGADACYAGETVGAASYAKVCSNAMMAMNMVAFGEAVTMAAKAGVDPRAFVAFCAGGGARNAMAESKVEKIASRDFAPTFRTELMLKDASLAARLAQELGVPTPSLNLTKEMYRIACQEGLGDEDHCSIVKCYEKWSGVEVK